MPASFTRPRLVVLLAFEGVALLDLAGPLEAFTVAATLRAPGAPPPYRAVVASTAGGPLRTTTGLAVGAEPLATLDDEAIDTLIVPGSGPPEDPAVPPDLVAWLARRAPRVRRTCAVCTGAFLLAAAGLLDGRRAATHWRSAPLLAERHPRVRVDADSIYLRDGAIWTSAGISAGIDLTLALVEEDLGHRAAMAVARQLVVFLKRPGGQSQFSAPLAAQAAESGTFADLHAWMADRLAGDLRVERLAAQAGMSPRTFARAYTAALGQTPAKVVAAMRLEAACQAVAGTDLPLKRIAHQCGFGDEQNLRRAFQRRLGVGPLEYRERFAGSARARGRK
ncbi:helix-turn-helix domain-containing protein [Sorangium sp. So ce136]|uniref:GlxA family transcriptional regulator n=1 Tax=Sorangium sp. So ce136 TaxID=3133284 RepID=UPI003EFE7D93